LNGVVPALPSASVTSLIESEGAASLSVIVRIAVFKLADAVSGVLLVSVRITVSSTSSIASSVVLTVTVLVVSPGAKLTMTLDVPIAPSEVVSVYSVFAVAVPEAVTVTLAAAVGMPVRVKVKVNAPPSAVVADIAPLNPMLETNSNAPMSSAAVLSPSPSRERAKLRWSVASAVSPRSIAGLPKSSSCVNVAPPLFCKGPSSGSMGLALEPT